MIINRELLKVKLTKEPISKFEFEQLKKSTKNKFNLTDSEVDYFVFKSSVSNQAYNAEESGIKILLKTEEVIDVAEASDHLNLKALSKPVKKYFVCYPKDN
jgi:hypothetical protein